MVSLLNECGMTLERRRLRAEKQAVEMETQRERLRSNCFGRFPMIYVRRSQVSAGTRLF